jgi:hypothetical protein
MGSRTSTGPVPRHILSVGQRLAELDDGWVAKLVEQSFELTEVAHQFAQRLARLRRRRELMRRNRG